MSETTSEILVTWLNVPTEIFLASLRHIEDLTHELRLIDAGGRSGVVEVPSGLAGAIHEILDAYPGPHQELWQQLLEAADAGRERMDVSLRLPADAVEASRRLLTLLDKADELCRRGVLMTMPSAEPIVEIRRWTAAELERQLVKGGDPVPFP